MNSQIKKRLLRIALLSALAFAVGAGLALFEIARTPSQSVSKGSTETALPGIKLGGGFALNDHNGDAVTHADYAGQYKLIYFGFTYCPAICPTELQKITEVLNTLDGDRAQKIQPLFITIDPERDTTEVMREYVSLFHPRLVGLSGDRAQIDDVLKSYRVFATKVELPENNDYTMDHSSFIYLMSPDDTLISMYRIQDDAAYMIADIRAKIPS